MTCSGSWKPLAWNGVSVRVPTGWDPAELQAFALRASGDAGPVLELKWRRVQGRFDPQRHLARLDKELGSRGAVDRSPKALPRGFADAAQALAGRGLDALPYAWQAENGTRGAGALLHNPASSIAALAQFVFRDPADPAETDTALAILDSYQDHGADPLVPWAAFGIRAQVPPHLELRSFSFTPGHFRLSFAGGKGPEAAELVLDRLGPADALLGSRSLAQYADLFYGTLGASPGLFDEDPDRPDQTSGALDTPPPLLARLLRRAPLPALRGRMWRAGIGAMLLGAFMRARTPRALAPFDPVCESYALART